MHPSAVKHAEYFVNKYLKDKKDQELTILDVGSFNVNGNLKALFMDACYICYTCGATDRDPRAFHEPCCNSPNIVQDLISNGIEFRARQATGGPRWNYIGLETTDTVRPYGPLDHLPKKCNVDVHYQPPAAMPFADNSIDVLLSTSCLEHDPCFWLTFREMVRVMKIGGLMYINVPGSGPYHGYPMDCWRFRKDSYQALADSIPGAVRIREVIEEPDDWMDIVGILQRQ